MKFNLSDFLQLDTKELLAVNGGSSCSSSSGSPSDGSGAPSSSSTNSSDGGNGGGGNSNPSVTRNPNGTVTYHQKNGQSFTYRTQGNNNSSKNGNNDNSSKTVPEAWSGGSGSSGGGSCSTSSSNNPNGQGPSTTSSNPGGDTKIYSGGGTCTKTGGHSPVNPDDVTSGGGTCSSKNDTDKVSGMFGQITDGSYADKLTMQYYKNGNIEIGPFYCETPEIAKMHDSEMNGGLLFSKEGCLMTCTAKTVSQECDDEIYLRDINRLVDTDADGNLTTEEIAKGIDFFLDRKYGDIYDVIGKDIYNVSISDLDNASIKTEGDKTYVFGNAPDCHGGHWVVLEGYSTNENGQITFSYDGSSDNDIGRTFIMGKANQDSSKEIWGITRIQTFTIHRK